MAYYPSWDLEQYANQDPYDDSYQWNGWGGGGDVTANYGSQTAQQWRGDDGLLYTKDIYGNVFNQYGFQGNDAPQPQQQQQQQQTQTGGGPQRPPGVPGDFVYYAPTDSWRSPNYAQLSGGGGGGGTMGGGQQPGPAQYPFNQEQIKVQREALAEKAQNNQAYLQYLNAQLAQTGKTAAEQAAIERERVAIERQAQALNEQRFQLEQQADQFSRGMKVSEVMSNPRSLVQSLMLMGGSPSQVAGYLQSQPLAQQLGAAPGVGQVGGWAPAQGGTDLGQVQGAMGQMPSWQQLMQSTSAAGGGGSIDPTTGRNTLFPFIEGRKLPVQQTLQDIQSNNPRLGVIQSLAGFSGQQPESFFGEFQNYLPKGAGTMGLAGYK